MNKLIHAFIIILISASTLHAQDSKTIEVTIENLSKKWELVDLINAERTKEELIEMLSFLEGTTLLFNIDMTYEMDFITTLKGSWVLNETFIYTDTKRSKTKWVIHRLEEKRLILSRNEAKQKLVFNSVKP